MYSCSYTKKIFIFKNEESVLWRLQKPLIIDRIYAANPKMTKDHARDAVDAILHILQSSFENGEDVLLSGFGKLNGK